MTRGGPSSTNHLVFAIERTCMTKTNNTSSPRVYEKPVAWLLGKQLIGGLKGILLYVAYGEKLDPRDWMTAEAISFDDESKTEFWFDYLSDAGDGTKAM